MGSERFRPQCIWDMILSFFLQQEGQRLVFREGRTKAVGNVTQVIPHNPVGLKDQKGQGQKSGLIDSHGNSALLAGDKSAAKAARNELRNSRSTTTAQMPCKVTETVK